MKCMAMIRNRLITGIFLLAMAAPLFAQDAEEKNDKIQTMKVAFITEKIMLTPKEAQVFWPVYNECQEKKDKINLERRTTREYYNQHAATMTDKEAGDILNKLVSLEQQDVNLFVEYNNKYKQLLPVKKVMDLYIAENQFKAWIISRLRGTAPVGTGRRK